MTIKRPSFTDKEALEFHSKPRPGKLAVAPTKPMATQRDLSLAYSPGVAVPVKAIAENEDLAYDYTSCLLYTSPSPRDQRGSRMPSSA